MHVQQLGLLGQLRRMDFKGFSMKIKTSHVHSASFCKANQEKWEKLAHFDGKIWLGLWLEAKMIPEDYIILDYHGETC